MRIKEVSDLFNIPITSLRYYEEKGLFDDVKRINGIRDYSDKDIKRLSLILSLKQTGLKIKEIATYIQCSETGKNNQEVCIAILEKQRKKLLDYMHQSNTSIDCIDYLIFKIEKNKR